LDCFCQVRISDSVIKGQSPSASYKFSRTNNLAETIKNAQTIESPSGKKFLKLPKLDNYNYIFTNSFHGYESGVLLYRKGIQGLVYEGVIAPTTWNKIEFYTYLNGLKVGVYIDDEGGFMMSEDGSQKSDVGGQNSKDYSPQRLQRETELRIAGLQTRKDNTSSGSEGESKDSTIYSYYFSYDGQGNVVQVSNKAGELPYYLYAYDSYGATTEGGGSYEGHLLASYKGYDKGPFGYKTGVRQYDPETGRFLSPDPFKGYMTDPASQHPYMYCRGNPVNYADPSGYDRIYTGMYPPPNITRFLSNLTTVSLTMSHDYSFFLNCLSLLLVDLARLNR